MMSIEHLRRKFSDYIRQIKPRLTLLMVFSLLLFIPYFSDACPLCKPGGAGGSVAAYQGTTFFLALLPFAFLAAIFYWLKNKINKTNEN